jgi:adenosylmethionine-8-amino-7-oxononanoate aminotransferase
MVLLTKQIRRLPGGEEAEILSVGLACSECFSGPRLAKILKPGFDYERRVMEDLSADVYSQPLSIHTSGGVTDALTDFVNALAPHLPWKTAKYSDTDDVDHDDDADDDADVDDGLDWCVSLQLEGASAVWAAIDMVLQDAILTSGGTKRLLVAVGSTSYHGPPSTSVGSYCPIWHKTLQVTYPAPTAGEKVDEESLTNQFEFFLDQYANEVGVILFEPQWGSSQAGYPWPKSLLQTYIAMARTRGIKIVTDEIMCGLGRHGNGSVFVSTDWDLDPDAVTFGKAIGGGVYPISGAVLKRGRNKLCQAGCSVMQSHTYSGSSVRALMAAAEVLRELPKWLPSIKSLSQDMAHIFEYLAQISLGLLISHGQGLMWGCLFTKKGMMNVTSYRTSVIQCFHKHCNEVGVLPYFVPSGGFMVTPHFDIDVGTLYAMGEKLEKAIQFTISDMDWRKHRDEETDQLYDIPGVDVGCSKPLQQSLTRPLSCASSSL